MTSSTVTLEITSNESVQISRTPRDQYTSGGCALSDCRPFLDFSATHICESRNVNWNSMSRRRSKSSVVASEWLIPDKTLSGRSRRGEFSPSVVVDERSVSLAELKSESVAQMLLTASQNEVQTQICFSQGGFEGFSEAFPELCYNSGINLLHSVEPEPMGTGRRTPVYDQDGPVELSPFSFLGSAIHSSRRETSAAAGITAVLNVSSTCPNFYEGELQYLRLTVEDTSVADIRACFHTAISFIDSVKKSGGRVSVHCQAGISRSATICSAYLMHTQRVRSDEAFDFVKQRRHIISPNSAFMGQLSQFETDILCQG